MERVNQVLYQSPKCSELLTENFFMIFFSQYFEVRIVLKDRITENHGKSVFSQTYYRHLMKVSEMTIFESEKKRLNVKKRRVVSQLLMSFGSL